MGKGLVVGIIIAALLSSAFWIFVLYSKDQSVTGSFVANVQDYPTVNQINFDDETLTFRDYCSICRQQFFTDCSNQLGF